MALYQHCSLHTFLSHLGISFSSGHGAGDPSLSPRLSLQVKIQRAKTYSSRDTGAAKGMPRGVRHHANIAPSTSFVFGPPLVLGTPCAPSSLLFWGGGVRCSEGLDGVLNTAQQQLKQFCAHQIQNRAARLLL